MKKTSHFTVAQISKAKLLLFPLRITNLNLMTTLVWKEGTNGQTTLLDQGVQRKWKAIAILLTLQTQESSCTSNTLYLSSHAIIWKIHGYKGLFKQWMVNERLDVFLYNFLGNVINCQSFSGTYLFASSREPVDKRVTCVYTSCKDLQHFPI